MFEKYNRTDTCARHARRAAAALLLLACLAFIILLCAAKPAAGTAKAEADDFNAVTIPPAGLTYEFHDATNAGERYYAVTGIDMEWAEENIQKNVTEVNVKFPEKYDDKTNGSYNVTRIAANAFHCEYMLDDELNETEESYKYVINKEAFDLSIEPRSPEPETAWFSITGVDFSEARNIEWIESRAFTHCLITTLDLRNAGGDELFFMPGFKTVLLINENAFYDCKLLEDIYFPSVLTLDIAKYAFAYCGSLRAVDLTSPLMTEMANRVFEFCQNLTTVYLNEGITALAGSSYMFGDSGPENLVFDSKESYESDLLPSELERYRGRMTYETDVTFVVGEETVKTQRKLYGRALDYEKSEKGVWARNPAYCLPQPENEPGYFFKWLDGDVFLRESGVITAQSLTAERQYALRVNYYLPPGKLIYANAPPQALKDYIEVWLYSDAYTCAKTDEYTLTLEGGKQDFTPGENAVYINCNGMSVAVTVNITAVPYEPSGLSPWETAGIIIGAVILFGVAVFLCLWLYIKRRKKLAFVAADFNTPGEAGYLTADEVAILRRIIQEKQNGQSAPKALPSLPNTLTLRERDVALLLLSGKVCKEIASELSIAVYTAREHIQNILNKTECDGQLSFAIKYGGSADKL